MRPIPNHKGVTLIELLVAISLLTILFAITVSFYPYVAKAWNINRVDTELRNELSLTRDTMSAYLRRANTFTVANQGRIYFTANTDITTPLAEPGTFYLYNPADVTWPNAYPYTVYELRYTDQPVFGTGRTIAYGLNPPPQTAFSSSVNQIAILLSATKSNQSLILQFAIRPRNM